MAFDAREKNVGKLLNDTIYIIPRNQRRYVWDKRNWEELFDDIRLVADGVAVSHFIGSIVLKKETEENGLERYTIIDGQQRIITLTILLATLLRKLNSLGMKQEFQGTIKYLLAVDRKANKKHIVSSEYHQALQGLVKSIIDEDSACAQMQTLSQMITGLGRVVKKDDEIKKCFLFFDSKLDEYCGEDKKEKLQKFQTALLDVNYVEISANTDEDAYTIFEILNARGIELEDYELLKNFIMRYIQPEDARDDAKKIWEEIEDALGEGIKKFIYHYAIHKFDYRTKAKSRDADKPYKVIQKQCPKEQVKGLLADLRCKAEFYKAFLYPHKLTSDDGFSEFELRNFALLRKYKNEQCRPLLMTLMEQKEKQNIADREYEKLLDFLYKYFTIYKIIGNENSNNVTEVYYKYAYLLEQNINAEVIEQFKKALQAKKPNREQFDAEFQTIGWSHHHGVFEGEENKTKAQLILEIVEKIKSGDMYLSDFTIEHILDDADSVNNGIIGNLLPLEENLNKRCVGLTLEQKMEVYKLSSFKTTRDFVERYKNQEFDPKKRSYYLGELLYKNIIGE